MIRHLVSAFEKHLIISVYKADQQHNVPNEALYTYYRLEINYIIHGGSNCTEVCIVSKARTSVLL